MLFVIYPRAAWLQAEINFPEAEGIVQIENFGMHLNVDGTIMWVLARFLHRMKITRFTTQALSRNECVFENKTIHTADG